MQAPGLRLRVRHRPRAHARAAPRARRRRSTSARRSCSTRSAASCAGAACASCREVPGTGELDGPGARRPLGDRDAPGRAARQRLLDERRRHLPGRRAHHQGLPLQDPRLVPRRRAGRLHRLRERLQRAPRRREQQGLPLRAAPQRRGERHLDVRRGPPVLQARSARADRLREPQLRGARRAGWSRSPSTRRSRRRRRASRRAVERNGPGVVGGAGVAARHATRTCSRCAACSRRSAPAARRAWPVPTRPLRRPADQGREGRQRRRRARARLRRRPRPVLDRHPRRRRDGADRARPRRARRPPTSARTRSARRASTR